MEINSRLKELRKLMKEKKMDAYIINTADPHGSEYLAEHFKTREWISGFTGSAGLALVTHDKALLWTDGRYFIQAEKELENSEFEMYKMRIPGWPTYIEWLKDNLKNGATIGFQGQIYDQAEFEKLEKAMAEKDVKFQVEWDLVGKIWKDRPELPKGKAFIHELKYTGKTAKEKIDQVRQVMKEENADYYLVASLDDIAWMFNIRGRDVECNPVILSYALISEDQAILFADKEKFSKEVEDFLLENGVEIKEYDEINSYMEKVDEKATIYLDKVKMNRYTFSSIPETCKIINKTNISTTIKARKNPTEIENQKNAYLKDATALVKYFYWLDKNVGKEKITEFTGQEKLLEFRKGQEDFIEQSFGSISGYKENAAMMHYSAQEDKALELKREGLYLIDSGGQYLDGTTDITRTLILGEISQEEKRDFTLVFKGHLNLASARFLYGATGHSLDVLARYPLWQEGLDYKSGTGHGVGYLLNVHEGPHNIAMGVNSVVLEEGMVVTIEPGIYTTGSHGIRTENVYVVEKDIETDSGQFMKFELLSYVPIDLEGIDVDLLDRREIEWLNNYHEKVYEKLSPLLTEEEKDWLKEETRAISK